MANLHDRISKTLLETLPGPAALIDSGSALLACNAAFREQLRLAGDGENSLAECLRDGGPWDIFPVTDEGGSLLCRLVRLRAGGPAASNDLAASLRAANQRLVMAAVAAQEAAEREESLRAQVEERAVERERLLADLQAKTAALTEADRRKNEFMALLGHELRNPLAAISTSAQLLDRLGLEGPRRRSLDVILRQTRQLTRMVDDLLDVARVTHGRIQLRRQEIDLREPTQRALEVMRPFLKERGHELMVDLGEEPLRVQGDAARLEQVITNLLHNAAKYTEPGGRIVVRAWRDAGRVTVRISDTGIGIDPKLLPILFEPFAQADRALARSSGGLGLGLALVKQLIALHGGTVEAQSEGPGQGSQFTFQVPVLTAAADLPPAAAPRRSQHDGCRRILLVEDQADVAGPLSEQLRLLGYEVRVAHSGAEALRAAAEELPEMLLLDIGLPDIDGYEVARQMFARAGRAVPTIALSGYGQPEDLRRSEEAGFLVHLVKPVNLAALQEVLEGRR